jgi:hypothetical protein
MFVREIKRRQNKHPSARTVAESTRAQALVMDRKGDVSHVEEQLDVVL